MTKKEDWMDNMNFLRTFSGEVGADVVFVPGCWCGDGAGGFS